MLYEKAPRNCVALLFFHNPCVFIYLVFENAAPIFAMNLVPDFKSGLKGKPV